MFRIESYVTSIILSYVDRYIKNFRLQDAQVSLWEGDGVFHNLDLDLEVLEQELNLPFTFVSGHINELMIHVPWTRINSSPVRITINTIECVIKLRSPGARQTPTTERVRRPQQPQKPDDSTPIAAPPTYTSHLVNKIICNLSVTCNNFILKYVEEDIVFSMNIKTLNLESVNSKWEPAFLDLSPSQLVLRKLISLSDVTICLDKRNASGRIESYMEPLLYRCFLTMRLSQTYPSVNASRASSTRLDIYCEKMAFTLSEPQVPMLIRMCALALALQKKQLTPKLSITALADITQDNTNVEDVLAIDPQTGETWSNWVWSWVPTLPFLAAEGGQNLQPVQSQTLQLGFYIDVFTLALKLCNMTVDLQGCLMELESHDTEWTNVQMGISHMNIVPSGDCCCGTSEQNQLPYLTCGTRQCSFLSDSLFGDSTARKVKERSWDYHIATVTEALLLEKTPAFAVDYLFVVQTPQMSEFDDEDEDDVGHIRQPVERVLMRHVADGVVVRICSGLIHRTQMILKSASTYDYVPYTTQYQVPEKSVESFHEFDHLGKNLLIPQYMARFTLFRPSFEIYPANHSPVQPSSLGRKLSRSQKRAQQASSSVLPTACVVVEWSCLDAKLTRPLNPDKVAALSSIFESIPSELISDAETRLSLKVVGVTSSMRLPSVEPMKILEISSVSLDWSLQPLISLPKSIVVTKVDTQIEQLMFTLSNPKLLLVYETINSLIMSNNKQRYQSCFDTLFSTSLIQDASASIDMVYLKVNLDRIAIQWVQTGISECVQVCVDACQAFVMQIADKAPNLQTMILVAPNSNENKPLMTGLFQRPLENETKATVEFHGIIPPHASNSQSRLPHGPVLMFCVHGIRISIDPLLYTWLLYSPLPVVPPFSRPSQTQLPHLTPSVTAGSSKSRKVSEGSSSAHKRALTPQESVHSSSERETSPSVQLSQPITEFIKEPSKEPTFIEKVSSLYPVWQSIVVCGDISDLCIYFPNSTLCSQLPQPMESSLQTGLRKSPQLQVAVLKIPSTTLLCSSLKHTPFQLPLPVLPVILPQSIWTPEKCNFPWSLKITDLQCYTLHGSVQLKLLKPLSATCTVGVSTKYNGSMLTSLALCVHLDTTAISISISEEQVALLVGLAVIHAQVLQTLLPVSSADVHSTEDILLSVEPPIGSDDSLSISQLGDENNEGAATGVVKLTGWMQWTLARFTLTVYNQPSKVTPESLKLTLDVEDIFFSLDIERVYHKLKFKVSTASIQHYCRSSSNHPWVLGPFQGLVMRGYDPDGVGAPAAGLPTDESASNSSGFLTATLTRACCSNLHSKLGTPSKATKLLQKGMAEDKFVTEIAVKLQPLDIVLSPNTIGTILNVLNPLLKVPQHRTPRPVIQPLQQKSLTMFTSSSLPLLYLDLMAVRIVLPAGNVDCQHDVILIQFDGVTTSPQPENPICRIPVRLDIYQAAEKHRILNVPGSEIEDRQYQVDIVALTISTGMWSELKSMLLKDAVPSLQNPALDWNEGRRPSAAPTALETMLTVIPAFNICFVVAPAIVYRDKVVVCGHSVEVNAVSEVMVTISTDQIELCGVLANEISNVLPAKLDSDESGATNVPLWIPQPQIPPLPLQFDSIDSGLETFSGSTQPVAKKGDSDVHTLSGRLALSTSPAPSGPPTITTFSSFTKRAPSKEPFVPLEILITGAGISCNLCKIVNGGRFSDVLPLLHSRISQPHVFIAKLGETKKFQASVYDLSVRCGKSDNPVVVSQNRLSAKDFLQSLFETRSGDPHPKTGIPPALLTMKWIQTGSKPIKLDIDLGRPIRITVQVDIIEFLKNMKSDVITRWNIGKTVLKMDSDQVNEDLQDNNQVVKNVTIGTQQPMSSQLKNYFSYFSTISLSSQKILFAILTRQQNTGNVGLSVDKITLNSVIAQHTITSMLLLEALSVSTQLANKTKLLLNPWSLSVKIVLLWENWSPGPIFQGNINSEVLSVDISPRHIQCLQHVQSEFFEYFQSSSPTSSNTDSTIHSELPKPSDNINGFQSSTESDQQEQHYKEDLQAGAFQFIDGGNDQEDLPLIYQVVFSTGVRHNPTMAWRYPQPRALTRLHIQPLPFRDSQPGDTVGCVLQYWSDSHSAYKDYINFSLCESAACTVALPTHDNSIPLVAATWRVVLGVGSNPDPLPVNVKALAACLRVDSYFCPTLVPNIQIAVTISTSTLTLWADICSKRPMPAELSRYVSDGCLPLSHLVLTLTINQSDLAFSSWTQGTRQIVLNCRLCLDVLNYRTLNLHTCIEPFQSISCLYLPPDSAKSLRVVSDPITCRIGPSVCHTLATASQLWTQYSTNQPYHFIVVTPYVVCNNSCLPIRFGQVDTDEIITLHCLQCHLYSWRSTKCPLSLKFSLALPDGSSRWSKPIQPLKEGSVCITVCDEESRDWNLVITMKRVTNFLMQVTVAGQLLITNNSDSNVELLISSERQNSLVVPAQSTPPGVILSPHFLPFLRIRYPGISFTWSGVVSLKCDGTNSKKWLVKIPLQDKNSFRSLWCHIMWDKDRQTGRILVVLNSMFKIMSNLPCGAVVKLQTPELDMTQMVSVNGQGDIQDLNCPGTPHTSHKLTFQLDGRIQSSSPEVPLCYSMVENEPPATPKHSSVDINSLLEKALLHKTRNTCWPLPSSEWAICNWSSAAQPDTIVHVKVVQGKEWIEPTSLQVELQPWALLLNSVGCHISLQSSDRFTCSLPHLSVLAPPTLESTFHLGLYIGTSVYLSNSLQLSRDKAFYMPHISGLIPLTGHMNTMVDCDSVVSFVNILSTEVNNVRIIHIRSSFVIANFSSKVLKVAAVVVGRKPDIKKQYILPPNIDYNSFTLKPQKSVASTYNKAFPITEWICMSKVSETMVPYLAVSEGGDYSCPIEVPQSADRQSTALLVPSTQPALPNHVNSMLLLCSEQRDGQTFLTIWDQPYPAFSIHNLTDSMIIFAKAVNEKGGVAVPFSPDWEWQLRLPSGCSADYQLPGEIEPDTGSSEKVPVAVIATDYRGIKGGFNWSEGIALATCRGKQVHIPGTSDITVAIIKRGFTTHVTFSHASNTEISPLDVRSRLTKEAQLANEADSYEKFAVPSTSSGIRHRSQEHFSFEEQFVTATSKTEGAKSGLEDIHCFVRGLTLILAVEGEMACDCKEISAFVVDNIALTCLPSAPPVRDSDVKELLIRLTLGDMQLDNQLYNTGGYDFPVILMTKIRETNEQHPLQFSISAPAFSMVEMSRVNGSAMDLVLTLDVNSYKTPVLQDVSVTFAPMIIYIEDLYLLELKDHLMKAMPAYTLTDSVFDITKEKYLLPNSLNLQNSDSISEGIGNTLNKQNLRNNDDDRIMFFNLKQNVSEELDDDKEELFNVSEPDVEIQGFGLLPEVNLGNEVVDKKEDDAKENRQVKEILFESDLPWIQSDIYVDREEIEELVDMYDIPIPKEVIIAAQELAYPLRLRSLTISPLVVLVSLHTSTTFYIGLDHSPLNFSSFHRGNLVTTAYRLGHALTLHYFLGAFYGSAWAIVSLEMLGAPGGLARTVTSGLRDFVSLPYQGIQQGPRAFLTGIAHGSASLMRHVTAGTLTSVTKMAASWARTLDRLTLTQEDLRRTEEARRSRPQGVTQGFMHGLTEFGISLLGAMGSLVHQPLQYAVSPRPNQSLVNSIGLGVMGVFTRPLSGAAELVALTGEGLLSGAGWSNLPRARIQPKAQHIDCGTESMLLHSWKILRNSEQLLLILEASSCIDYQPAVLLLTRSNLYIMQSEKLIKCISLADLRVSAHHSDPTLIFMRIVPLEAEAEALLRSRLDQFVRDSQRVCGAESEIFSPPSTSTVDQNNETEPSICYFVNPQMREYFITFVTFVRRHAIGRDFPLVS